MSKIQVPDYASFKLWWEKTNEIGGAVGDFDNFISAVDPLYDGATEPNLVSAINSIAAVTAGAERLLLARAIAMS